MPSSPFAISIGAATVWVREPLGPFTATVRPSMVTSTPAGTAMGSLPMRDIAVSSVPFRYQT